MISKNFDINATPKSMEEAIYKGILTHFILLREPVNKRGIEAIAEDLANGICPHVKDFLAQKFGAYMFKAKDEDTEELLMNLFKLLGCEPKKEK